jgi:hypothetical protein
VQLCFNLNSYLLVAFFTSFSCFFYQFYETHFYLKTGYRKAAAMSKVCRPVCFRYAVSLTNSSTVLVIKLCFKCETYLHFQNFIDQSLWMSLILIFSSSITLIIINDKLYDTSISLQPCWVALKPNQNVENSWKSARNMEKPKSV